MQIVMRSINSISKFVASGIRHNIPSMHINELATGPDSGPEMASFPPYVRVYIPRSEDPDKKKLLVS